MSIEVITAAGIEGYNRGDSWRTVNSDAAVILHSTKLRKRIPEVRTLWLATMMQYSRYRASNAAVATPVLSQVHECRMLQQS